MIGVTSRRAAERVPDVGEIAVLQALESDITHARGVVQDVCCASPQRPLMVAAQLNDEATRSSRPANHDRSSVADPATSSHRIKLLAAFRRTLSRSSVCHISSISLFCSSQRYRSRNLTQAIAGTVTALVPNERSPRVGRPGVFRYSSTTPMACWRVQWRSHVVNCGFELARPSNVARLTARSDVSDVFTSPPGLVCVYSIVLLDPALLIDSIKSLGVNGDRDVERRILKRDIAGYKLSYGTSSGNYTTTHRCRQRDELRAHGS